MENTIDIEKQIKAFPPGPNWYSEYTTSVTNHYYVYATKTFLVIFTLPNFEYKSTFTASLDKINVIDTFSHFCFVAGVDPVVRIWNLLDGAQLTSFQYHKTEVTALKCIRDGSIIISGDKSGLIVVQEAFGVKRQQKQMIKSEITALEVIQYQKTDYTAVGYQNGMITIYTIDAKLELNQICQLSHPNDTINSLAWKPIIINQSDNNSKDANSDEQQQQPLYLASSAKRMKTVIVWLVLDAMEYCTIKLPNPQPHYTNQQKSSIWITLEWSMVNRDNIYVSSYAGEILCYTIRPKKATLVRKPKFEQTHNRIIFNICTYNYNIITTSLDKQIVKWNPYDGKKILTIKTQSGFPYSLDISSLNPMQVAIGYGDSAIKVWKCVQLKEDQLASNKKKRKENPYESTTFWRGLQGQIKKVQWHPTKEGILAFSTEYGHIGVYDTYNNKSFTFRSHRNSSSEGSVPSLAWIGDVSTLTDISFNETLDMTNILVTCDSEHLFLRDANHHHNDPINLNDLLQQHNQEWYTLLASKSILRTCVATNPSGEFLALGDTDGSVEIYYLKSLKIIYASNTLRLPITAMHWKDSKEYSLLATGCRSGIIAIHKIEKEELNKPYVIPTIQPLHHSLLKGHKNYITDIKWSHHSDSFILASTSEDNLAIIWKIEESSSKIISCFDKHHGYVLSVCWQHLNPDILLTGGEDRFVYMWNWKGYPLVGRDIENTVPLLQREKKKLKKKTMKSDNTEISNKRELEDSKNDDNNNSNSNISNVPKDTAKRIKKQHIYQTKTLLNETSKAIKNHEQMKLQQKCFQAAISIYEKDPLMIIDNIKNQLENIDVNNDTDDVMNKYSVINIHEILDMENQTLNLLFGNKNDVRKLVGLEVESLVDNNTQYIDTIPNNNALFGADMKLALNIMRSEYFTLESYHYAGDGMMLTDWIVLALSPIAGKEKWLKLMEEQANKLQSGEYYHLAATCFIACSKIYEAVNVYRQASMYKEALVVAKLRLSSDESLVSSILSEWASLLQSKGEDELAALCYIQSQLPGSTLNAIHLLGRRGTESSFFWSACLASIINDDSLHIWVEKWKNLILKRKGKIETNE